MSTPDLVLRELLPLLRRFCPGEHGIALGGSHAKGGGDALSDVDVYLFADRVVPGARRRDLVLEALGEAAEAVSWGRDEPFTGGGTDFTYRGTRVECWLRSSRQLQATIAACRRGEIRREHSVWAVMGFFDCVALADMRAMRIVEDPGGMLARWKAEVAVYPEPLRRALLGRFMAEAAFWPDNFHYASAVERADAIYVSGIVQQVAQALVQVVFALNGEYFPGEKRLDAALEKLPVVPPAFARRLRALLFSGEDPGVAELREQRRALGALVAEVERLVAAHGGAG
ncbi:MAG TPA: DUF4037 domain-containing protein [Longimicrobiaceae bacterium]|nr:DUF4037 domain-containing protein [Longimicrobiaceae bacterium]